MGVAFAQINQLVSLTHQPDHVVSNDDCADVVKVVVCEVCSLPRLFRQGMAFIRASTGIEDLPASLAGVADYVLVISDEVIERRRIEFFRE